MAQSKQKSLYQLQFKGQTAWRTALVGTFSNHQYDGQNHDQEPLQPILCSLPGLQIAGLQDYATCPGH